MNNIKKFRIIKFKSKPILSAKSIAKSFDERVILRKIDIHLNQGEMLGLLGPNGAGKSTFINILAGLVNKSGGKVYVCGVDLDEDPKTVRGNLGIVPQEIIIDPFFTPLEIMNIQSLN